METGTEVVRVTGASFEPVKRKDVGIEIKVEQCIDSEDWVWMLLDTTMRNGVICDGYEASEQEAWEKAKERLKEEIDWRNGVEA